MTILVRGSHNEEVVRLASTEALYDLLFNGVNNRQEAEKIALEKLNVLYGPGMTVDYRGGVGGFFNW